LFADVGSAFRKHTQIDDGHSPDRRRLRSFVVGDRQGRLVGSRRLVGVRCGDPCAGLAISERPGVGDEKPIRVQRIAGIEVDGQGGLSCVGRTRERCDRGLVELDAAREDRAQENEGDGPNASESVHGVVIVSEKPTRLLLEPRIIFGLGPLSYEINVPMVCRGCMERL